MNAKPEVTPEFEELYRKLDRASSRLAYAILDHVSKNDVRLLKKINIRLEAVIADIEDIK